MSTLSSVINIESVQAYEGTIIIQADGSVTPDTAPIQQIGNLYILTEDITFEENGIAIMVNRSSNIVLDGQGHSLTRCGLYTILVENVTITNFNIINDSITLSYESTNVVIHKNKMSGGGISLHFDFGHHEITENTMSGISSVMDSTVSNNIIAKNNITSNGSGIRFNYASFNNTIVENNISNVEYGIFLGGGSNNYIAGNNLVGNRIGIYLTNFFMGSAGQYGKGFSQNNTIVENYIASNTECGLSIFNSTWIGSKLPNYIYHNIFKNNTNHVSFQHPTSVRNYTDGSYYTIIANSTNVLDDGYPSGGNYWSDYTGIDADGDGIGDTVYVIDEYNVDNYPLTRPISFPVIQSCDSKGTITNIFDITGEVWVKGNGFSSSFLVDIYVVEDVINWLDKIDISSLAITSVNTDVPADTHGDLIPTPVWTSNLKLGKYDLIVDANQNGIYDEGIDAIDNNNIKITGGIFVIPEYWLGTIMGLLAMFASFAVFYIQKRRKK